MAYQSFDGLFGGGASISSQTHLQVDENNTVDLPASSFVRDASITRDGMDLILDGPDGTIVIDNYFSGLENPLLNAPDGSSLTPELVNSFVQHSPQYAQAGTLDDVSPVGIVAEFSGEATVTHPNGMTEVITSGTPIYQGDIIETSADGAVNIQFIDDTSFAVSEDARLAIDEYVFDPATQSGEQNFSVLKGMFVFTSGLIGRDDPDDVNIETPTGSIGIRGTIIAADVDAGEVTVVEGAIVVRDLSGNELTLANQFETARIAPGQPMQHMGQLSAQDVATKFTSVSNVSPTLFSSINDAVIEQGGQPMQQAPADTGTQAPAENGEAAPQNAPADANGSVDQNGDTQVDGTVQESSETSEGEKTTEQAGENAEAGEAPSEQTVENSEAADALESSPIGQTGLGTNNLGTSSLGAQPAVQARAASSGESKAAGVQAAKAAAAKAALARAAAEAQEAAADAPAPTNQTPAPPPSVINNPAPPTSADNAPQGQDRMFTIDEDTQHHFGPAQFPFTDADGDALTGIRIDTLPSTTEGVLTLNGVPVTVGQGIFVASLPNLVFTPAADFNGTATFQFSVRTSGGSFDPSPNTMTLNVTAIDDAPELLDQNLNFLEDSGSHDINLGSLISDPDSSIDLANITISGSTNGSVSYSGGIATYTANADFNGTDSFTYTYTDENDVDHTATIYLTIDPSNDAPTTGAVTININEDTSYAFSTGDFIFSDIDAGDFLGGIKITSLNLDADSYLKLNGTSVTSGQIINASELPNLIFTPGTDEFGTNYSNFQFEVFDNNGAFSTADIFTFNVDPIADPLLLSGFDGSIHYENYINDNADFLDSNGIQLDGDAPGSYTDYTLKISSTNGQPHESYGILNGNNISISGNTIQYYSNVIGNLTGGSHGIPLEITLTNLADNEAINALLSQLSYQNFSDTPQIDRTIMIELFDNVQSLITSVSNIVSVYEENDVPIALRNLTPGDPLKQQSNIAPDDYFRVGEQQVWSYHFNKEFVDFDGDIVSYKLVNNTASGSINDVITYLDSLSGTILLSGQGAGYLYDTDSNGIADTLFGTSTAGKGWSYDETTGHLQLYISDLTALQGISFGIVAYDDNMDFDGHNYTVSAYSEVNATHIGTSAPENYSFGLTMADSNLVVFAGDGGDTITLNISGNPSYTVSNSYINAGNGANTIMVGMHASDNTIIGGFHKDEITVQNATNTIHTMDGDDKIIFDLSNMPVSNLYSTDAHQIHMGQSGFRMGQDLRNWGFTDYNHGGSSGAGDTLVFQSSNSETIDFRNIDDNYLRGVERIQMGGTPNHTLILNYNDVIQMTDHKNTLIFRGDNGDTVNFDFTGSELTSFTHLGIINANDDYTGMTDYQDFDVWSNGEVTLLVDTDVNTTGLVA